ncbi:ATP-dependent DNA helicase [Alternaria arborescens]|uniref:DNA 3'-5' helicase n=1 Tax=Alternaria arborescens TaxID=156630 RepID=A0A4Q4RSD3_9PLEO|nr:ATP-dependent DNA helicase [Alternaria arborescens]RYN31299.1 ATP-dependent DNA helicase [Alternaria arborescens]RYO24244.1 ATP-dependent DNA helicase [Alternaria arborescens]RYO60083.1 ATP-dependent DNA helicase [Alternaria arborescens]
MDALLEGLNDAQRSAVTSPANVVQVLAPPGSGKTKTLTARVAYHINHERLQPWNIIVCTFTIKAAREMKERIKGFVGEKLEAKLILGTFHSVARRFLSRYGQEIGIDKNFGIADTSDSTAILKRIVTRHQYTVEPGHARSRISKLKAKGTTADDFRRTTKNVNDNEFAMIYSSYQEHLAASNLLDYDDLLLRCVDLLKKSPSCVSTIQAVLIDEYQDTNNIQYELMRLLAQRTRRITIVGDPDQSIYSFRSAEIKNLLRMRTDYPEAVVINLENNYRSSGCILTSAMAVIEQDESRPQKSLIATHGVGEPPTLRHLVSANVEAKWIVEEIHRTRTLAAGLLSYNDYAILVRSSPLTLQIERALGQAGIPYRMVAGTKFFDRAEIRIILDYLRVVSQPDHNDAVARVINTPSRKVGDVTVKALLEEAEVRKVTLWKLVLDIAQGRRKPESKVSAQAQKGIEQFVNVILTSREKLLPAKGEDCNLLGLISHILAKIQFQSYLKQTHKENWEDRWANVEELVNQATQMATAVANGEEISDDALPVVEGIEQRNDTGADILSKFLANVTLSSAADQEGSELDQVTISTIHAAKGLEWPVVFMPAVYDGSIPHSRADDQDEERRLLYVGMTRAQGLLYLSCPVKQSGQEQTTLSRFISDRKIQKLFNDRGPDLAFKRSTIPDLARILRRDCPSSEDIKGALGLLEHPEDDRYPATREEIDGDDPTWGAYGSDKYRSAKPIGDGPNQSFKRRRLESSSSFSTDSVAVTMNRASGFSIATTTMPTVKAGFTSARDLGDLQAMQREAERIRTLASTPNAEIAKAAYNDSKKAEAKPARAKSVKPLAKGQGAITSFFKRSNSAISEETETAPSFTAPSLQRSQSSFSTHTPLHDISNVQSSVSRPPRPFQPLSMPNHKVTNRPILTKPKRVEPEAGMESTREGWQRTNKSNQADVIVICFGIWLSASVYISHNVDEPSAESVSTEEDAGCEEKHAAVECET